MTRTILTSARAFTVRGVVLITASALVLAAPQAPTKADADAAQRKVIAVTVRGAMKPAPGKPLAPLRTTFTEREINAYLKFSAGADLPAGVTNPHVTLLGEGQVSGLATVDLDAVRRSKPRGMLDPMNLLTGMVQVTATGVLKVNNGLATLQIDKVTLGGVTVPKSLLQELVAYYSKTGDRPQGIDLDKPFPVTNQIRSIEIQRGAAIVIQ